MNILTFPELFCLISANLNDSEKIFLILCSKIMYNYKPLLILDSEYNLEEINDKWCTKNIIIKNFSLGNKIKELIKDLIPESIIVNSKYVKFISNNTNIKLFLNENIIEKLFSCGYSHYLVMKIMLSNDDSINNINLQFIISVRRGYLSIVKLLIDLGADIHAKNNQAIIMASYCNRLDIVKLLIDLGADIHAQNNQAIVDASMRGHLSVVQLLINSGADIHDQNNQAIVNASSYGHLHVKKLLIESITDIHAQNIAIRMCTTENKYLDMTEFLKKIYY